MIPTMPKYWMIAPLTISWALNSTIFYRSENNLAQAFPLSQITQVVAQSRCSAADLARTSPPFRCVTPKVFSCLKRNNTARGGSLEYRGDTSGEIVVKSDVAGTVALLGFNFNASSEVLNLNVKKKNFAVQEQQIWDGFKSTLSKCR
ncbi:hypothetical protein K9N68_34995 (plasmid) [Kovacikia minuta CCNUW1]|uniref:hypothetical protein n=1 Tax=Kovacikia minuta TaxID=2931930 RepID=UPI001CCEFB40|nr:hypothetical protein [Kovacikia minuta]UBF30408.1 hypothetical protein K9N68_34995 [Kovacikia minuta CCNUW1]